MTFDEFLNWLLTCEEYRHGHWRYGQTMFNYLHRINPDLADEIRGTTLDPFYFEIDGTDNMTQLLAYLKDRW